MVEESKCEDCDVIDDEHAVVRLLETTTTHATTTTPRSPQPSHTINAIVDFFFVPTPTGSNWMVAPVFGLKTVIDLKLPSSDKPSVTIHHQNAHQYSLRRRRRHRKAECRKVYLKHLAMHRALKLKKNFEQVATAIPGSFSSVFAVKVGMPRRRRRRRLSIRCSSSWCRNSCRLLGGAYVMVVLLLVALLFNGANAMQLPSDSVAAGSAVKVAVAATSGAAVIYSVARQGNIIDMFARTNNKNATAVSTVTALTTGGTSKRLSCDLAQGGAAGLQADIDDAPHSPTPKRLCPRPPLPNTDLLKANVKRDRTFSRFLIENECGQLCANTAFGGETPTWTPVLKRIDTFISADNNLCWARAISGNIFAPIHVLLDVARSVVKSMEVLLERNDELHALEEYALAANCSADEAEQFRSLNLQRHIDEMKMQIHLICCDTSRSWDSATYPRPIPHFTCFALAQNVAIIVLRPSDRPVELPGKRVFVAVAHGRRRSRTLKSHELVEFLQHPDYSLERTRIVELQGGGVAGTLLSGCMHT
jgi:hypothetical protein